MYLNVQKQTPSPALYPTAETYVKWDHRTWVYNKPDTYVGSDEPFPREEWVFDVESQKMMNVQMDFVPACERLFLEILTNASDNVGRSRRAGVDPGPIEIVMSNQTISVTNYGLPIPIEINPKENEYVPQMIFGSLLSSSNYEQDRHEAGTNGIGAKATNIFSTEFMIIIHDHIRQLKYTQIWRNNMVDRDDPIIEPYDGTVSSVQTIYNMDFARFGYPLPNTDADGNPVGGYGPDAYALFARHAVDISFNAKTSVVFNGMEFKYDRIREYARLYFGDAVDTGIIHYQWPEGTQVVKKKDGHQLAKNRAITPLIEMIAVDTPDAGSHGVQHHVSFANCMMTRDGGVHVNSAIKAVGTGAVKMINESMLKVLKKQNKGKDITAKQKRDNTITLKDVKDHISILLSAKVVNPKFTSQTKTILASPTPKITVPENNLRKLQNWQLIDRLYAALDAKQFKNLSKTDGKSRRYIRLTKGVDANEAGQRDRHNCVLYITEGKSGAGYANKLVSLLPGGRDNAGVLPMRGKGLNVMGADRTAKSRLQLQNNREINELKQMLGLREGTDYTDPNNFKHLRYGSVMIMADSDVDGKHIIGLILLYFHCRFPSLLQRGYVMYYRTPTIRVTLGKTVLKFYTPAEYEVWKMNTPNFDKWKHKYYKGLGSSRDAEIRDDYKNPRVVHCFYDDSASDSMKLAFAKSMSDRRKIWINQWRQILDIEDVQYQPISDFINQELILFSIADVQRSIPNLMDGLKESTRKIVYGAHVKWNIGPIDKSYNEYKVAQFGSFVAEKSKYHHGELILSDVVVGMSQDFIGSNNIPWFTQDGQFGTRYEGGKDASETRYSHTRPTQLIPYLLRREDQPILTYLVDEGDQIEPQFYAPVIPTVLVNGAYGIGTGYSTFIPNHNPLDLIQWLRLRLQGSDVLPEIKPWYRGFTGEISIFDRRKRNRTMIDAVPEDVDVPTEEALDEEEEDAIIDEYEALQLRNKNRQLMSFQSLGNFEVRLDGTIVVTELPIGRWPIRYRKWLEKLVELKEITGYRDMCDDMDGKSVVYFEIYGFKETPNHRTLKLKRTIGMSNMVLLDEHNRSIRYDTSADILEAFHVRRLPIYQRRKIYMLEKLTQEIAALNERILFIRAVAVDKTLRILNRPKHEIFADMDALGLPHYLLDKVRFRNASKDEIDVLSGQIVDKEAERERLVNISAEQMWMEELDQFEQKYRKLYSIRTTPPVQLQIATPKRKVPTPKRKVPTPIRLQISK